MAVKFARYTTTTGMGQGSMTFTIHEGEAWDADDPLVKAHPNLFSDKPLTIHTSRGTTRIEDTSAAPGKKRNR